LLLAPDTERLAQLDLDVRMVVADTPGVRILGLRSWHGSSATVAEYLWRLHPGFVLTHLGSTLIPREGPICGLSAALECPMLVVR
jgi:hypothetical protein